MSTADSSALGRCSSIPIKYVKKHYEVPPRVISTHCVSPLTIITTPFYSICERGLFLYKIQAQICHNLLIQLRIVMYEMLIGHPSFDGNSPVIVAMQHIQNQPEPPGQFNPNIPVALEEIILRCIEKAPGARFSDGSHLARALEKLGDAKMGETVSMVHHLKPHGNHRSFASIITTSILLATLLLLGCSAYLAVQLR